MDFDIGRPCQGVGGVKEEASDLDEKKQNQKEVKPCFGSWSVSEHKKSLASWEDSIHDRGTTISPAP